MASKSNTYQPENKNKRKKRSKRIFIIIAVLLAGILIGTTAFGVVFFNQDSSGGYSEGSNGGSDTTSQLNDRVSFLLIGADKRSGDTSYNTDTLIVASVDPDTKLISLLSIPRDTRISLNGSNYLKINSVAMLAGLPELLNQVTALTGIELDGYVLTNFDGFKSIIDTLGGIDINVEMDMYKETGDKVDGVINLKKGEQHLSGTEALQYARFRGDSTADIGRTARQQKVLTAVAKEILQPSTLTKLTTLVPQLKEAVETDLNLSDVLKLSKTAANFDSSNMVTQTLPGYGLYLKNISFWEVNRDHVKQIAQNLLLGITTNMTIDGTVIDLLDPDIKANITVPGSSSDPNGTESPGHDTSGTGAESTDGLSDTSTDGSSTDTDTGTDTGTDGSGTGSGTDGSDTGTGSGTDDSSTGTVESGNQTDKNSFSNSGHIDHVITIQ